MLAWFRRSRVACASTGNTSAALAVYCSATDLGFRAIIFIGSGKIAYGKLAQALDHGALTIQIVGDFDDAMQRVRQVADRLGIYLMNSVNPFRLEGQKTIIYRILEGLRWEVPDWIVVPGGNLGNSSAFGKALIELKYLGLIARVPRLAVINAAGARTLHELVGHRELRWRNGLPEMEKVDDYYGQLDPRTIKASTIASAIEINRPVNLKKCLRALEFCHGVVTMVTDQEIMDAKARVGAGGLGCEPASAASVAGAKRLREEGVIAPSDRVVCILTGHQLKDPTATVAYHSADQAQFDQVLGSRGVRRAGFANRPDRRRQRPRRHHPDDRPVLGNRVVPPGSLERKEGSEPCLERFCRSESMVLGSDGHALDPADRRRIPTLKLAAALERAGHPDLGEDAGCAGGRVRRWVSCFRSSLPAEAAVDVMIDFSLPPAALAIAECCRERTDSPGRRHDRFRPDRAARPGACGDPDPDPDRAQHEPGRQSADETGGRGRRSLGQSADIAIIERHHRTKKDAPSGTALRLAEFAGKGLAVEPARPRAGRIPLGTGEIDIHALRIADSPGEHTVIFWLAG